MNRDRWNRLAHEFEASVCDIAATDVKRVLRGLVTKAIPRRGKSVLVDLGCGIGTFLYLFGSLFTEAIGVDYSTKMLTRARGRCVGSKRIKWLCLDIFRASRKIRASADVVACLNVITSPRAAQRQRLWDCVVSVMKPGGYALIVVPSLESAAMVAKVRSERTGSRDREDRLIGEGLVRAGKDIQKYYGEEELRGQASDLGLRVEAIRRVSYPWDEEGLEARSGRRTVRPWDWVCLARLPRRV